jgi:hypothetical protein
MGLTDKAKDAAETVKEKVSDAIPDGLEEKASNVFEKIKDKIEDIVPGDRDGDGH